MSKTFADMYTESRNTGAALAAGLAAVKDGELMPDARGFRSGLLGCEIRDPETLEVIGRVEMYITAFGGVTDERLVTAGSEALKIMAPE